MTKYSTNSTLIHLAARLGLSIDYEYTSPYVIINCTLENWELMGLLLWLFCYLTMKVACVANTHSHCIVPCLVSIYSSKLHLLDFQNLHCTTKF